MRVAFETKKKYVVNFYENVDNTLVCLENCFMSSTLQNTQFIENLLLW